MTSPIVLMFTVLFLNSCASGLFPADERDPLDKFKGRGKGEEVLKRFEETGPVVQVTAQPATAPIVVNEVKKPEQKNKKTTKKEIVKVDPKKEVVKEVPKEIGKEAPKKVASDNRNNMPPGINVESLLNNPDPTYPKEYKEYDRLSAEAWKVYHPNIHIGESFNFRVSYLGIKAGNIKLTTMPITRIGAKDAYYFHGHLTSAKYYSYIYELDDVLKSYIDVKTNLPIRFSITQRESKQNVDDLQLFELEKRKYYAWYKRVKKDKNSDDYYERDLPKFVQDSFFPLMFTRGLPLKTGDTYQYPIMTRGSIWIVKIKVAGVEKIDVDGNDVEAIRIQAETQFPGVLSKAGDIVFWYGNDPLRKLLKFEAKVKIGAISGELVDYTPGK